MKLFTNNLFWLGFSLVFFFWQVLKIVFGNGVTSFEFYFNILFMYIHLYLLHLHVIMKACQDDPFWITQYYPIYPKNHKIFTKDNITFGIEWNIDDLKNDLFLQYHTKLVTLKIKRLLKLKLSKQEIVNLFSLNVSGPSFLLFLTVLYNETDLTVKELNMFTKQLINENILAKAFIEEIQKILVKRITKKNLQSL